MTPDHGPKRGAPIPDADAEELRRSIEAGQFALPSAITTVEMANRMQHAVGLIVQYGGIDGGHHKQWVLDQVVRALTGDDYQNVVTRAKDGEDGPETYSWETGIAP